MKPLRNHQINYKWGQPVQLVITEDNKTFTIRSVEEGISLLRQWKILEPGGFRHQHRTHQDTDWEDADTLDDMTT